MIAATLTMSLLMISILTVCGPLLPQEKEKSLFTLAPIQQLLEDGPNVVVIYYSKAVIGEFENFMDNVKTEKTRAIFIYENITKLKMTITRYFAFTFLVLLKKDSLREDIVTNFLKSDIFIFVQTDNYNQTETTKICNSVKNTLLSGLYEPFKKELYACKFFCHKHVTNCLRKIDLLGRLPNTITEVADNYSNFQGFEFNIGYVNSSPAIFK